MLWLIGLIVAGSLFFWAKGGIEHGVLFFVLTLAAVITVEAMEKRN